MSIFLFNGFLLLCFVVATVPDVLVLGSPGDAIITDPNPPPKKCRYSRANGLVEARCSKLELEEIPFNLRADIQVLDFNINQVRTLKNDSLYPYKKLAYIYLRMNFIHEIEEAAFANQPYLEVLDLAKNRFLTLPKSLFQMPYLRTLYLDNSLLTDSAFKMKVTSPLRLLQLSENELTAIPNIGSQPTLLNLNVSENKITSISTENLAPFCVLKELDLTRNNIRFNAGSCDCQTFNAWVKLRQIKMKPDLYKCTDSPAALNEDCVNGTFSNRTYELFNECLAMIQQKMEKDIQQKMEKDIQQKMEKDIQQKKEKDIQQKKEKDIQQKMEKDIQQKMEKDIQQKMEKDIQQKMEKDIQQKKEKDIQQKKKKDIQQKMEKDIQQKMEKDIQQKMEKDIQQKMEKDIQQKMEPEKPRSVWIHVASCVSVFLLVIFVALVFVHKRNRTRRRKQEQQQLTAIYNNTELLQQQPDDNYEITQVASIHHFDVICWSFYNQKS